MNFHVKIFHRVGRNQGQRELENFLGTFFNGESTFTREILRYILIDYDDIESNRLDYYANILQKTAFHVR